MPSKLSIYNGALRVLGERRLTSLTEAREPRRLLDDVWDDDGVKKCLQMGQWNFAIRTTQMDYDPSISPGFGFKYAFGKPSDFVRVAGVCSDEFFRTPLTYYMDNAGYWFCDLQTIYVRYVSDDTSYGFDYSKWPPNFTSFVEAWFALQIANNIATQQAKELTKRDVDKLLKDARATDAQEEPPGEIPMGTWSSARLGSSRREPRPRGTLY